MSQSFKQSFLLGTLLLATNLIAAIALVDLGARKNLADFNDYWVICVEVAAFYWFSCQVKRGKYRFWLLPAWRIFLWSLIIASGFVFKNRMASEDLLYAFNEGFVWWELFKLKASFLRNSSEVIELIMEDIVLIALVESALIGIVNAIFPLRTGKYQLKNET
jgi:hypothetical protein